MRDLIDERNRREKLKKQHYKRIQCSLCHTGRACASKRGRRAKKAAGSCGTVTLRRSRKKVALELERRREMEQREL